MLKVAKVLNYVISKTELLMEMGRISDNSCCIDQNTLKNQALLQIIDRYLILNEACQHNVTIDDDEFERSMIVYLDSFKDFSQFDLIHEDDEYQSLRLEQIVRNNMIIKKYLSQLCNSVVHSEDEKLKDFYEEQLSSLFQEDEVRASHILIKGTTIESKQKIESIWSQIHSVEDFHNLCKSCSDCPSYCKCGDLGYFPKGRMIKEIEDVAFNLEVNQISKPFSSEYGYHILLLTDKRKNPNYSIDTLTDCMKNRLKNIEEQLFIVKYIKQIRQQHVADIHIYEDALQQF